MAKTAKTSKAAKASGAKKAAATAWDRVKLARDAKRPHICDFIGAVVENFVELHGDRFAGDDPAVVTGFGMICGMPVLAVGHNKGSTVEENVASNFGMANPEGYRKAMRLAKLAERFGIPVATFIDTPGAYPGREAEERGQAEAIAKSLEFFSRLATPIVVVVTGEGGSGGALAIGVGDKTLMMENAVYSVISPEGCAGILWRDGSKAPEAAEALKPTAADLLALGVVDEIVPEPAGGAQKNPAAACAKLKKALAHALREVCAIPREELVARRYARLRACAAAQG